MIKRKRREDKNDVSYDSDDEEGEKDQMMVGRKEKVREERRYRETDKERERHRERESERKRER